MRWNDLPGTRIGPYAILDELGRGGSARVFRALQDAPQRQVAIKIMVNDADDPLGFVRRFEREVELVAQLDHPNVVPIYDSGQHQDLIYLVMRFINGGTLRQRFGRPLSLNDACVAMIQMGHALHHAHQHGIVHRDVKPSNMLVATDTGGQVLLTDFGIAKLRGMRGLTKSGTTIGTPEYMAPEQAEGREVDQRADVYSLGCVLYEALAGRPPFVGPTPVSVLYQQVHARPDYIRGLNADVPRDFARLIEIALAKRPEDRFVSAESFAHALEPYVTHPARFATPLRAAVRTAPISPEDGAAPLPFALDPPAPADEAPVQVFGKRVYASGPIAGAGPAQRAAASAGVASESGSDGLDDLFPEPTTLPATPGAAAAPTTHPAAAARPAVASGPISGPRPTIPLPTIRPARRMPSFPRVDRPHRAAPRPAVQATAAMLISPADSAAATAMTEAPMLPARKRDAPTTGGNRPPGRRGRNGQRSPLIAAVVLSLVALGALVAVLARSNGVLGLGLVSRPTATATTAATATATPVASPTATLPAAVPTASPTHQQVLDQQAVAAFRAITLAPTTDSTCSSTNATTRFTTAQYIYVNLCLAQTAAYGHITVLLRQNGATTFVITRDAQVSPGSWYAFYTYNVSPGSYDVLVAYNGGTGADMTLTVR